MPDAEEKTSGRVDVWYAFVAFIIIGVGVGFLFNQVAAGALIGVGVGFLTVVLLRLKYPERTTG